MGADARFLHPGPRWCGCGIDQYPTGRRSYSKVLLRPLAAWVQHPLAAFLLWPLAASKRQAETCRLALWHFMGKP